MGIKNKKQEDLNPMHYSMLGKIPDNYPCKILRGLKMYDMPAFKDEKYGYIPSGKERWASIMETMETVEPIKPKKPVTQKDIDDFIAHAKEKLKTVKDHQTREACRQIGLQIVRRMKREKK